MKLRNLACAAGLLSVAAGATEFEAPVVDIVGVTPLPGLGVPLEHVPANVQVESGDALRVLRPSDLAGQLARSFANVIALPNQNNPYQSDLVYRGFMASPLAGSPQGLSVFLDGVRINEAFGDTVNWDLIPPNAIDSAELLPASNPAFGLNTLGGALALQTRRGDTSPGTAAGFSAGSWGRADLQVEHGGHGDAGHYFIAADLAHEDGWREHSASDVGRLFARAGARSAEQEGELSVLLADTRLNGVQALPLSMLGNPRQAYTWPDLTENRLAMIGARGSRSFGDDQLLNASLYLRQFDSENHSSNTNDDFGADDAVTPGNAPASMDRGRTESLGWGAALQYVRSTPLFGRDNQLTLGASVDAAHTRYRQWTQPGIFTSDRGVDTLDGETLEVGAGERHQYLGLYFSELFSPDARWHLTLSGRWNLAQIHISDDSGDNPALAGDHRFQRFNPAAGFTFTPHAALNAYASYGEGMRVATPMELTCADPAAPCKLPNDFLADPPLKPVVSRTVEAGLRGGAGGATRYSAAVYRTRLRDDIQFISSGGSVNAGYFQNVGDTRRIGFELAASHQAGPWELAAGYSFVRASFESGFAMHSPANSSADAAGDIAVRAGDRMPGVPEQSLRLRAGFNGGRYALAAELMAIGPQYARGDENNQDRNGQLPGYAVVNLDGRYRLGGGWEVFAEIRNLFDHRYEGSAVLGENFFRGPGGTFDMASAAPEQFRSPGAPFGVWLGLRYAMD